MKFILAVLAIGFCLYVHAQEDPAPEPAIPPCGNVQNLKITVDNELVLYVDGVEVAGLPNRNTWQTADTVSLAASASVIAVKGTDYGVTAGILASGGTFVTDHSWRCTNQEQAGWQNIDFDDSAWGKATVIGKHGVTPWGEISGISASAKWIWTPRYITGPDSDKVVYCRKTFCRRCTGTGKTCITDCSGRADGDYQSCQGCNVYATCSNGYITDKRPCPASLVWDDKLKRCEYTSKTCKECPKL